MVTYEAINFEHPEDLQEKVPSEEQYRFTKHSPDNRHYDPDDAALEKDYHFFALQSYEIQSEIPRILQQGDMHNKITQILTNGLEENYEAMADHLKSEIETDFAEKTAHLEGNSAKEQYVIQMQNTWGYYDRHKASHVMTIDTLRQHLEQGANPEWFITNAAQFVSFVVGRVIKSPATAIQGAGISGYAEHIDHDNDALTLVDNGVFTAEDNPFEDGWYDAVIQPQIDTRDAEAAAKAEAEAMRQLEQKKRNTAFKLQQDAEQRKAHSEWLAAEKQQRKDEEDAAEHRRLMKLAAKYIGNGSDRQWNLRGWGGR